MALGKVYIVVLKHFFPLIGILVVVLQTEILFNISKFPFYISVCSGKYSMPVILLSTLIPRELKFWFLKIHLFSLGNNKVLTIVMLFPCCRYVQNMNVEKKKPGVTFHIHHRLLIYCVFLKVFCNNLKYYRHS